MSLKINDLSYSLKLDLIIECMYKIFLSNDEHFLGKESHDLNFNYYGIYSCKRYGAT